MEKINQLLEIPQYEQRSEMWFKQREDKLTSSDAAAVLNINPYQTSEDILFKKCGLDLKPFVGNVATLHGQKYEDEAIHKYNLLTGTKNYDFGLLCYKDVHKNDDYYWLAGSPDGISIDINEKEARPILLEVKCPYRRIIKNGKIPEYYYPQVQLNLFICGLNVADFIEYKPPDIMNIVRIYKDDRWLNKNLILLEKFWKDVEYYRVKGIETHPKFKKPKNVLNLYTEQNNHSGYAFRE